MMVHRMMAEKESIIRNVWTGLSSGPDDGRLPERYTQLNPKSMILSRVTQQSFFQVFPSPVPLLLVSLDPF